MPAPTQDTLIDAVNERDEEIGRIPRGDVLREGRNFRTAHIFVVNDRGELLLQRLAAGRDRHPGRWGSSVAAYLFAGESYRAGAERRLEEELDLRTELRQLGKIEMRDEHSLKFVSAFLTRSNVAENHDPGHLSELAYLRVSEVERSLRRKPENFTPTFAALFTAFGHELG